MSTSTPKSHIDSLLAVSSVVCEWNRRFSTFLVSMLEITPPNETKLFRIIDWERGTRRQRRSSSTKLEAAANVEQKKLRSFLNAAKQQNGHHNFVGGVFRVFILMTKKTHCSVATTIRLKITWLSLNVSALSWIFPFIFRHIFAVAVCSYLHSMLLSSPVLLVCLDSLSSPPHIGRLRPDEEFTQPESIINSLYIALDGRLLSCVFFFQCHIAHAVPPLSPTARCMCLESP